MLSFECDYNNGAHPAVLQALLDTNEEKQVGYGQDDFTAAAILQIKRVFGCPQGQVFLLGGGTQTNQLVIDSLLDSHQGVLACDTGHVAVHEAGAIEYTGHKVLTLPQTEGKLTAQVVKEAMERFLADPSREHMVEPGMVYISHPTEWGSLYTKQELTELYRTCRNYGLSLYVDGARLGYGLESYETDVNAQDLSCLCDVFTIGGTKVGALCGEAVVFPRGNAPRGFFSKIKQHGALFAKGRLLGVQFLTLFTDDLYFSISRHAIEMAEQLKQLLRQKGIPFARSSSTNQQFVVLTAQQAERLAQEVRFEVWEQRPDQTLVVRFATSWATTPQEIEELASIL